MRIDLISTLTIRVKKVFIYKPNNLYGTKYYLYLRGEWVEVDRDFYIDLMVMVNDEKVVNVANSDDEWVFDVYLDRRKTRIFKLVAKSFYNVEL